MEQPSLPATMRAWQRLRWGPARRVLELAADHPTPPIPTGPSPDILVRVSHVALQANSQMFLDTIPGLPFTGPWIPEIEFSGEVVAAGDSAPPELRDPGCRVIAFIKVPGDILLGNGVLAEYVRVPGSQAARIDDTADMASASGINGCGSTALKMIRTAGVRDGHKVLINGASGSVGAVLVQLCKLRGAEVVGVASGGNEALVRGYGADEFIDYREHDSLPKHLALHYSDEPFDFVLDCVGAQDLFVNSPQYVKPTGAVVNVGIQKTLWTPALALINQWLPTWLGGVPRRYFFFSTPPTRADAVYLARLIEEGQLRVPVDSVFDMENAVDAYERVATKRARGKVVIKVRND